MSDEDHSVDEEVARELYPVSVRQARAQVIIQVAVIAAFVVWWAVLSFRRQFAWTVGMITVGAVATAYDIRWWLWLRRANPVEAYARVQTRDGREGGAFRSRFTLIASIGLFALWWLAGK
jgi:hypothetical protein